MTDLIPTPTTAKAWADAARFPGEDADIALRRRITMHEYLMTGGVKTGVTDGKTTYSAPITLADLATDAYQDCPWHPGDDCTPWNAIVAGNGVWTALEAELEALRAAVTGYKDDEELPALQDAIKGVEEALSFRPNMTPAELQPKLHGKPKPMRDHDLERKISKQARTLSSTGNANGRKAEAVVLDLSGLSAAPTETSIEFDNEEESE